MIVEVVVGLASTVSLIATFHYGWLTIVNPRRYVSFRAQLEEGHAFGSRRLRMKGKLYLALVYVGSIFIAFLGIRESFSWIPPELGSVDENGFTSLRTSLSACIAFFVLPVVNYLEVSAYIRVELGDLKKQIRDASNREA